VGELADPGSDEIDHLEPSCYLEEPDLQDRSAESPGDPSDLASRRRKRRSAELRNSLRFGLLLVGLVGVNIYVFFFNNRTAPREVLNLQSTSKSMEAQKQSILKKDADTARAKLKVAARTDRPAGTPSASGAAAASGAVSASATATTPAAARTATAPQPVIQIPFAPPEEEPAAVDEAASGPVAKKIGESDTLSALLAREGFGTAGPAVVAALSKLVDPRLIRGGQSYLVRLDDQGIPESFEYHPTAVLRYLIEKQPGGAWKGRKVEQAVEIKIVEAAGLIESSLYESVQKSGEASALVSLLVELFAWDVNFYTDTHPGDHWKVIVEKQYLGGQYYKYGNLLAAEYGGRTGTFRAFYWKPPSSRTPGKYYDERGQAISKTMLKTPLRYVRISSKFDLKRFHPILHREKAHLGIDYAAPVGTPVWASASGRVVEAQSKHGSGNTVVIAHANGLATRYYHLSRFARGLHAGQPVRQKDVIGYVGTTGLSTGPHLHFSLTRNGAFVDPSKLQVTRDPSVPDRAAFLEAVRPRVTSLKQLQPAALAHNN
jgi:murein DD-endopeptidase MepM/ murein hydrolase activator NlpD